jgi:hypothetical protein
MQYFLKSAIGPNRHLQRVFVCDPALFSIGAQRAADMEMCDRECFSQQFAERIVFRPEWECVRLRNQGHVQVFVQLLSKSPERLLF